MLCYLFCVKYFFVTLSLLKFGIIKFLLLAIASKTIVELKAITTVASLNSLSPEPPQIKVQFLGKFLNLETSFSCTPVLPLKIKCVRGFFFMNSIRYLKVILNILFQFFFRIVN